MGREGRTSGDGGEDGEGGRAEVERDLVAPAASPDAGVRLEQARHRCRRPSSPPAPAKKTEGFGLVEVSGGRMGSLVLLDRPNGLGVFISLI